MSKKVYKKNPPKKNTFEEITDFLSGDQIENPHLRNSYKTGKEIVKFLDPTGISNYGEVYDAWKEVEKNGSLENYGSLALTTFGALPLIGKIGKATKYVNKGIDLSTTGKSSRKAIKKLDELTTKFDPINVPGGKQVGKMTGKLISEILDVNTAKKAEQLNKYKSYYNIANSVANLEDLGEKIYEGGVIPEVVITAKKRKKPEEFAYGGTAMNIDSPSEDLAQAQNIAQQAMIGAMSDPTVAGLKGIGNMFINTGMSMASQGYANGAGGDSGMGKFLKNNMGSINSIVGLGQSATIQASGGRIGKSSINAEGGEIVDTPNGVPVELDGPSHASGGIDLEVPQGTEIYSKRLKGEDGKSMADRKKKREKEILKVQKLLEKDPTNTTLKKTLAKIKSNNDFIDEKDLSQMEFVKSLVDTVQNPKFAFGGTVGEDLLLKKNEFGADSYDEIFANEYDPQPITNSYNQTGLKIPDINKDIAFNSTPNVASPTSENKGFDFSSIFGNMTLGDTLGMGANLFGSNAQMRNIAANKAATPTEVNAFKNYGDQALKKIQSQYGYINSVRDEQLGDAELSRQGTINRNNNSARGINTQRALNLATDAQMNELKSNIYNQFAAQTMGIIGQEAGQLAQNDQVRMQGEDRRAERELQNTDNFYSNMGKAISDKYRGIGDTGKSMNDIKERGTISEIMKYLFNNFRIDPNTGELVGIPTSTDTQNLPVVTSKIKKK